MSALKSIIKSSLELRNVDKKVLTSVDTLIQRAVLRLFKNDVLPPRTWEFTSEDKKNVKVVGDQELDYIILPKDYRSLDSFYVYDSVPYFYVENIEKIIQNRARSEKSDENKRWFTVVSENFDEHDKGQKWLVAFPFPEDDKLVRVRYNSNGQTTDWDWIDEPYWEMVISEVEAILGLTSQEQADQHKAHAIKTSKEIGGSGMRTLRSSYFGGKPYRFSRQKLNQNRGGNQ